MSTRIPELLQAMAHLFTSGQYSDVTVVCRSHKYPVHKAVLCTRSPFFERACNGDFAEANTGEINLSEEDEEAVVHMLHYFYYLDYLVSNDGTVQTTQSDLKTATKKAARFSLHDVEDPLIATASAASNKPQSPAVSTAPHQSAPPTKDERQSSLKPPSPRVRRISRVGRDSDTFAAVAQKHSPELSDDESVDPDEEVEEETPELLIHTRVYALAEKYGIEGLKALAREKFEVLAAQRWSEPDFLEAAEEAYTTTIDTDRGLRNVVLQSFRQRPELARRSNVQNTVQHVPLLAFDLYRMSWGIA